MQASTARQLSGTSNGSTRRGWRGSRRSSRPWPGGPWPGRRPLVRPRLRPPARRSLRPCLPLLQEGTRACRPEKAGPPLKAMRTVTAHGLLALPYWSLPTQAPLPTSQSGRRTRRANGSGSCRLCSGAAWPSAWPSCGGRATSRWATRASMGRRLSGASNGSTRRGWHGSRRSSRPWQGGEPLTRPLLPWPSCLRAAVAKRASRLQLPRDCLACSPRLRSAAAGQGPQGSAHPSWLKPRLELAYEGHWLGRTPGPACLKACILSASCRVLFVPLNHARTSLFRANTPLGHELGV
mmetsp:Transcript_27309/g.63612  ORF Transcript_27309/g.63612 Transcript_27309/m.63612 type:complete len:294 (-) Transcript_27309:76-957(-)